MLVSYLPQHYRIISRGTAEGISPYFVLLGTTSATAGFANILTVPPSRTAISCCKEIESFECAAGMLGVAQLGVQWLCFTLMLVTPSASLSGVVLLTFVASSYFLFSSDTERPMFHLRSYVEMPRGGRLLAWSACCVWPTA